MLVTVTIQSYEPHTETLVVLVFPLDFRKNESVFGQIMHEVIRSTTKHQD
jgi:hypothetical protein